MVGNLLAVMIAAGAAPAEPRPYGLANLDKLSVENTLEKIDPAMRDVIDRTYRNCIAKCGLPYSSLCGWPNKFSCLSQIHSCRVDCAMERSILEEAVSKQVNYK